MSRLQKVIAKLLSLQQIFTFSELEYLLRQLGYQEKKTGKTSGSRKAYININSKHIIRVHKPHPGNEIKKYVRTYVINELQKQNLL